MKQTREIKHGDGHIDIETLFGDVWAVTKCNLEVTMPQYTVSYYHRNPNDPQARLEIQRESITAQNAQEAREIFEDNDMEVIEVNPISHQSWNEQREIANAMIAEVAPMFDTLRAAVAGTFTVDDADGVDMIDVWNWQIEDLAQAANSFMTESQEWESEAEALSAEHADLAERASGCWTSYAPSAKELSKRVQPEIKEAHEVADNFNFDAIKPIKF